MIEVNVGDKVRLPDGTIGKVLGWYNQVKHRIFKLQVGDKVIDVPNIHTADGVEIVRETGSEAESTRNEPRGRRRAPLADPFEGTDRED